MDNLSKRAVLVSLEISHWSGRCVDKQVSDEVLLAKQAEADSGSFSKRLIAKEYLSEITRINNEARKYFKQHTMAWESGKRRLLPAKMISEFTNKMRELSDKHADACQVFIDNYDTYKTEAETFLNGLFNPADYPDSNDIQKKFGFEYEFTNIDSPDDFRCEVSDDVKEQIQEQMKEKIEEKYTESMNRLYSKVYSLIKKFHERVSDKDAILTKSLLGNIEDLVNILPDMNVMDDPKLEQITQSIQDEICRFDIEDLRHNETAREEAAQAGESLLSSMAEVYA